MDPAQITIWLSGAGVLATGYIALSCVADPVRGLQRLTHRVENLPQVMVDRYFGNLFLALAATIYGDLKVIAFLFAVFAFLAFADTAIYARARAPFLPHLLAGIGSGIVVIVALLAILNGAA